MIHTGMGCLPHESLRLIPVNKRLLACHADTSQQKQIRLLRLAVTVTKQAHVSALCD